jgi:NAD(P)-dependent dehydrogenase (short-subunit alcohol dehydrogenase family)/predicted nucleic acid-binding protein
MVTAITIRDVPDETRDELASRAALSGRSLQEYLRSQLIELARRPDAEVLLARVRDRKQRLGSRLPTEAILGHRDAGPSMTLVIDSGFVAAALVDSGPVGTWADHLLATDDLAAPHLMPVEVANVLRRAALAGEISPDTAALAHADLLSLRVELFAYEPFATRVWAASAEAAPCAPAGSRESDRGADRAPSPCRGRAREVARAVLAQARAWRADQLLDRNLQRGRDPREHREGRVRRARFDVRPRRPRDSRQLRELLLAEAARLAQPPHVLSEVPGNFHVPSGDGPMDWRSVSGLSSPMIKCPESIEWRSKETDNVDRHSSRSLERTRSRARAPPRPGRLHDRRCRATPRTPPSTRRRDRRLGRHGPRDSCRTSAIATSATRVAAKRTRSSGTSTSLVHCASTLGDTPLRLVADTEPDVFDEVLQVNLAGPFRLTKALLGPMVLRGRGAVVFVSSDAAVEGYPTWGAYGASKAGLDQLARVWAAELAGTGVRVVSLDPGDMDTPMHAAAIPDADPATLAGPEDVAARVADLLRSFRDGADEGVVMKAAAGPIHSRLLLVDPDSRRDAPRHARRGASPPATSSS